MQFIAEFLGSSILDPGLSADISRVPSRAELAERIEEFQSGRLAQARPVPRALLLDAEHKMILLLEYLSGAAIPKVAAPLRSAQA